MRNATLILYIMLLFLLVPLNEMLKYGSCLAHQLPAQGGLSRLLKLEKPFSGPRHVLVEGSHKQPEMLFTERHDVLSLLKEQLPGQENKKKLSKLEFSPRKYYQLVFVFN